MVKIILFSFGCAVALSSLRAVPNEAVPEAIQRQAQKEGYHNGVKYQSDVSNVMVDKDDRDVFMQHAPQVVVSSRPVVQPQSASVSAVTSAQQLQNPVALLAAIQAQQSAVVRAFVAARGPVQSSLVAPKAVNPVLNIEIPPSTGTITFLPRPVLLRRSSPFSSSPGAPGREEGN